MRPPRTVELLGPSGVGKSTTLAATGALRSDVLEWWGPEEIEDAGRSEGIVLGGAFRREALDDPALRPFMDECLRMVSDTAMSPSQKVVALTIVRKTAVAHRLAGLVTAAVPLVHDELFLHRAFSILPRSPDPEADAMSFFTLAPAPDAAVVFRVDAPTIVARVGTRGSVPNCYLDLDASSLRRTVDQSLRVAEIAAEVLRSRGVDVLVLDAGRAAPDTAADLHAFITRHRREDTMTHEPDDIRDRLTAASGSFRKKDGRHELRTRNVMYCAFSTPRFSVTKQEAQRDASRRLERFGITRENAEGRTALDLGSNAGAMLFELNNLGVASGLGIEYDQDKVDLATEIAAYSDLDRLRFEQGDIDAIDADRLGSFDIVLALAIEAHVQQPERLYPLLGRLTKGTLYFEGNNKCDMDDVAVRLEAAGFVGLRQLGLCDDDRDPRNNARPMLVAHKKRSWFRRRSSGPVRVG